METTATLHLGSSSVPITLRATDGLITVTGPEGKAHAFEGYLKLTWRDRLFNWLKLSFSMKRPLRCTFDSVRIETTAGGERLVIDPGGIHDEWLAIDAHGEGASILAEWNRGKLQWLHGGSVRCTLDSEGFSILETDTSAIIFTVRWDSVRAIRMYKRDLFSYDMICLGFQLNDKSWVEVWERSDGFLEVGERMREVFPGISAEWYSEVMLPAFATNDTLLYRRDDQSGEWPV